MTPKYFFFEVFDLPLKQFRFPHTFLTYSVFKDTIVLILGLTLRPVLLHQSTDPELFLDSLIIFLQMYHVSECSVRSFTNTEKNFVRIILTTRVKFNELK